MSKSPRARRRLQCRSRIAFSVTASEFCMNPSIRRRAGVTLAWTALGLMAYGPACMAQSTSDEDDDSAWDVGIGAGAVYHPDYEGSDDYEVDPVPLLLLNYRD